MLRSWVRARAEGMTGAGARPAASAPGEDLLIWGLGMSHHLDTPLAGQNGQLLIDDLYIFPGEGSTVFVMDVNSNVNGLFSEPGFHPEARYELKVHFNGAD